MEFKRVFVAAVFIPVFYFMVKDLPSWVFFVFASGGILWGMYEFYKMVYHDHQRLEIALGLVAGFALAVIFYRQAWSVEREWVTVLVAGTLLIELFLRKDIKAALMDGAMLLIGVFYVGWLLGHLILLRNLNEGEYLVFFVFLVTWSCDTCAYYTGKRWGRRALAPRISPNKTIEGAIGGLIGGLIASLIARWWFLPDLSLQDVIGLGVILGILGQLGDLVESQFKRGAGVKDSSGLLPAHGGILDKVDSLIFTAPAFYLYLVWIKQYS